MTLHIQCEPSASLCYRVWLRSLLTAILNCHEHVNCIGPLCEEHEPLFVYNEPWPSCNSDCNSVSTVYNTICLVYYVFLFMSVNVYEC